MHNDTDARAAKRYILDAEGLLDQVRKLPRGDIPTGTLAVLEKVCNALALLADAVDDIDRRTSETEFRG